MGYSEEELDSMDLWETVDRVKAKILRDTMNENSEVQAMMISFEVNQVMDELLELSIGFTRRIVTHK